MDNSGVPTVKISVGTNKVPAIKLGGGITITETVIQIIIRTLKHIKDYEANLVKRKFAKLRQKTKIDTYRQRAK
jgi:hypothetical protein